ncbi:MAG TPA: lysylphosphatidylglycerol synthase transmembrane domain-containing protein [Candidatus Angelobacter sp.]|nr:lysylphosphatidylglycerol synthase transmembrane domain-containing protein [Candidatus Angelobacter sp.]
MQTSSRKLLIVLAGLILTGFVVYQSSGFIHRANFSGEKLLRAVAGANLYLLLLSIVVIYGCYAMRALRWQLFQGNLGVSRYWTIYKMTLAGFAAVFILGRPGEPVRPLLLARKEKLPVADMFGIYALERLFDFASTAVIAGLALFSFHSQDDTAGTAKALETAARSAGTLLFAGVTAAAIFLVYLRLYGTAVLERWLRGWREAHGWRGSIARMLLGFARGVQAIRNVSELLLAILYSALHWLMVLLVYYWGTRSFGGRLGTLGLGDVMLVMAFSLVGSVVQLPAVGGGAQLASVLVYTKIFGVETEPATAAAIVLWLIGFAMCSFAGVPLLIHEGMSLGELRHLAKHEKEAAKEAAAPQGDSAQ